MKPSHPDAIVLAFSATLALTLLTGSRLFAQQTVIPTSLETKVQTTQEQRFAIETVTEVFSQAPTDAAAPDATVVYRTIASPSLVIGCHDPIEQWVTVLDLAQNEMVLLDRKTRRLARAALDSLVASTVQAQASEDDKSKRSRLGMDAMPKQTGADKLQIDYPGVAYRAITQRAPDTEQARRYGRYVDGVCRLNFIQELGPPPFARIRLNEAVARQGRYISSLALTIQPHDAATNLQASFVQSELSWRAEWTQPEMDLYRQVEQMLNTFEEVGISSIASKDWKKR